MIDDEYIMQTFGDHVNQFAQSVDIVSTTVYQEVLGLIQTYLKEQIGAVFFAVVIEKVYRLQPFLVSEWPNERPWWDARVKTDQNNYFGQTSLAYALGKPLWIVGANKKELAAEEVYSDLLGNVPNVEIPKYALIEDVGTKTSIILPLKINDVHFGIMNVESKHYLEKSYQWLSELNKLANAIAILHRLKEISILQINSTKAAKDRLKDGVADRSFVPVIGRREMFFASSSKADDEVVGVIKEVLCSYKSEFDLVHWTDLSHDDIHDAIWERVSACTYGFCYFSEPEATEISPSFRDNPNVLFEAGMLFALRRARRTPLKAILLVREAVATTIPFDLSAEYITLVPRSPGGQLNEERFRNLLHKHVAVMLSRRYRTE